MKSRRLCPPRRQQRREASQRDHSGCDPDPRDHRIDEDEQPDRSGIDIDVVDREVEILGEAGSHRWRADGLPLADADRFPDPEADVSARDLLDLADRLSI